MVRHVSNGWIFLEGYVGHPELRHYSTSSGETRYKLPLTPEVVGEIGHQLSGLQDHIDYDLYQHWYRALQTSDQIKQLEPDKISFGHEFDLPPFDHQKIALAFARHLPSPAIFMETGTGKTYVALLWSEMRLKKGVANKILVIAPKSILRESWWKDCKKFTNLDSIIVHNSLGRFWWDCPLCHKSCHSLSDSHAKEHYRQFNALADMFDTDEKYRKDTTAERFHEFLPIPKELEWNERKDISEMLEDGFDLYLATPDAVRIHEDYFLKAGFDTVIIDESTLIKNPSSLRTKSIHKLGHRAKFRMIMSGTPITNSLEDIWSQMYFLDQSLGPSIGEFRREYCFQPSPSKHPMWWKARKGAKQAVVDRISNRCIRITKEECLDLPPRTVRIRDVGMSGKSEKAYDTMMDDLYALIEQNVRFEVASLSPIVVNPSMGIDYDPETIPTQGWLHSGEERICRAKTHIDKSGRITLETEIPVSLEPGQRVELRKVEGEVTTTIKLAQLGKLQQITNGFVLENRMVPSNRVKYRHMFPTQPGPVQLNILSGIGYDKGVFTGRLRSGQEIKSKILVRKGTYHYVKSLAKKIRITHEIDKKPPKIREIKHLLDEFEPDRKVIIWAQYRHDFKMLEEHLESTVTLNGSTPDSQIEKRVEAFRNDTRIMLAHPASAQYGHTWNEANVVIYYTLSYSLLEYLQSRDRCYRIGQENPVTEFILMGSPTDREIYDSLIENRDFAEDITNSDQMRSLLSKLER